MTSVPHSSVAYACPHCAGPVQMGTLACPHCRGFIYRQRLEELTAEAMRQEPVNPPVAIWYWQQCLQLLPPDSTQHGMIAERIRVLSGGDAGGVPVRDPLDTRNYPVAPPTETYTSAFVKTVGSMVLSILVYAFFMQSIWFATGFVLLILVHELGHVAAMKYYRLNAGPPIFIPFMGALINLRQPPPDAKVEAVVGIGGPVAGTAGALVVYGLHLAYPGEEMFLFLAYFGFLLNLFNMLPVPPLDGGRVTAAVSPWIWMLGIVGLVGMMVHDVVRFGRPHFIMVLLLLFAWPRVWATLKGRDRHSPYYQISRRSSYAIAFVYVALGILLLGMFFITRWQVRLMFF